MGAYCYKFVLDRAESRVAQMAKNNGVLYVMVVVLRERIGLSK